MVSDPNGNSDEMADERGWAETRSLGSLTPDVAMGPGPSNGEKSSGELTGQLSGQLSGQFGRYRILRRLGMGGMGTVFLAHDSQFDHQVALKVPHFAATNNQTDANDQTVIERFYREARAAIKLRHSNLCPVYDVGEIEGQHFLSMAYIAGRPLAELIDANHLLPERQIARIVCKIALALQEAHENGVVHRDLKPGNIMIDEKRNEPIVMDFGLATQLDRAFDARLTQTGMIVGSPAYMSPEQVRNDGQPLGPATDIYSLGVILYELLIGRAPFEGSAASVLGMVAWKDPEPPSRLRPGVDPRLEAICLTAMAKNIDDRYESMRDFAIALAAFANPSSAGREFNPSVTLAELVSAEIIPDPSASSAIMAVRLSGNALLAQETDDHDLAASHPRRVAVWVVGGVAAAILVGAVAVYVFRPGPTGFAGGPSAGAPNVPAHPHLFPAAKYFDEPDRNRDGVLTPDEYPLHIILRADANGDQSLTRHEFDAAFKRLGQALFGPPTPEEHRELLRLGFPPLGGPDGP